MAEDPSRTHDVFLSYSSKDKSWADAACAVLERHNIRCWIAPRDIAPGDNWGAAVMKGLKGSRIIVLIFSGHANASQQVHSEVERASSRGMSILAFRIEDVPYDDAMELHLAKRHWLDAFTPPVERQLESLARTVKTLLGAEGGPIAASPAELAERGADQAVATGIGRSRALAKGDRRLAFRLGHAGHHRPRASNQEPRVPGPGRDQVVQPGCSGR
jgi:hypothetical protein